MYTKLCGKEMRLMQIHIDWLRINLGSIFYIDTDQPVDLIVLLVSLFVIKCWLPAYVAKLASILGAFVIVGTRSWHRSNYQSRPLGVYTLWIVGKGHVNTIQHVAPCLIFANSGDKNPYPQGRFSATKFSEAMNFACPPGRLWLNRLNLCFGQDSGFGFTQITSI